MLDVGFMQGRLSDLVNGRIQSFPWSNWQSEFPIAERHGFRIMEWTLDQERMAENPLLTRSGQDDIRALSRRHGVAIPSLTGDCFMQAPFWKAHGMERQALQRDFETVAVSAAAVGISLIVVPLVDDGTLENAGQEDVLVSFLASRSALLERLRLKITFESDFDPAEVARFIARLDPGQFGINYDIGNSAALGFDPGEEMAAYGHRITNVHVKDRVLHGTTVPLGTGNADFDEVFGGLARVGYSGNVILQTARAVDGDHAGVLCRYRDMTVEWLARHAF